MKFTVDVPAILVVDLEAEDVDGARVMLLQVISRTEGNLWREGERSGKIEAVACRHLLEGLEIRKVDP